MIRDEALRLFAERGPDAVSVRQIAAAAGVSPGLVVHHFGSKNGLREAVDRHVVEAFEAMLGELTREGAFDAAASRSLVEAALVHLPPDAPVYLRRLLASGSEAGRRVFRRLFEASQATLAALAEAGLASAGADPPVRAAILMANDLTVLMLRDQITDALGVDPLSPEGMERWARELLTIYSAGIGGTSEGTP